LTKFGKIISTIFLGSVVFFYIDRPASRYGEEMGVPFCKFLLLALSSPRSLEPYASFLPTQN
jgi:hypothetical protein